LVFPSLSALPPWVALATLVGVLLWSARSSVSLFVQGYEAGADVAFLATGISLLALWRQKASLARMRDGLETKLGDPPPVRGMDPNEVLAAFMVHPFTVEDLYQQRSQGWLKWLDARGWLSERLLRRLLFHVRPFHAATLSGITLEDGRQMRVMLIVGAMMPDQIRAHPDVATRMAIQGARFARELGAEAFGLGAFWSTVGDKGREVQDAVPEIAITNGGAYTAATVRAAVPGLLDRFAAEGGSLRQATAAVVGANGVVAFGVARMIVTEVGRLILIGRDPTRLERSAETLRK
jgi:predicted amino acid dehydrogenase